MKSLTNRYYTLDIPKGVLDTNGPIFIHTLYYTNDIKPQFFFDLSIRSSQNPREIVYLVQFNNGRLVHGSLEDKLRLAVMRQLSFPKDSLEEQRRDYSTIYQTLRTYPRIESHTNSQQ
jgi:hypothetical protein